MSDKTKHVTPSAPRTLSEKPGDLAGHLRFSGRAKVTRGIPIAKLSTVNLITSPAEDALADKLNEVIDRLNAMNEVAR